MIGTTDVSLCDDCKYLRKEKYTSVFSELDRIVCYCTHPSVGNWRKVDVDIATIQNTTRDEKVLTPFWCEEKDHCEPLDLTHDLEVLVDAYDLDGVVEGLEDLCYAKADHAETNGQDINLAKKWRRNARAIGHTHDKLVSTY